MASADRQETTDIIKDSFKEGIKSWDFLHCLRFIDATCQDKKPIAKGIKAKDESLLFKQNPSLAFPTSSIESFTPEKNGKMAELVFNIFGLMGPNGPMPLHFTEYVRSRSRHNMDHSIKDFLNIFHQRLISLYYRAWADTQQSVDLDRDDLNKFIDFYKSFIGIRNLPSDPLLTDKTKVYYAGRLIGQYKNLEGLQQILIDYFEVKFDIEEFQGKWIKLPEEAHLKMGTDPSCGLLGQTTIIGERIWDCQQKFRIKIGPLDIDNYKRFLPGGRSMARLKRWLDYYVGIELEWDVNLILKKEDVPKTMLSEGSLLGYTSWLGNRTSPKDADDLVLT